MAANGGSEIPPKMVGACQQTVRVDMFIIGVREIMSLVFRLR
jgi:hypothetical protein